MDESVKRTYDPQSDNCSVIFTGIIYINGSFAVFCASLLNSVCIPTGGVPHPRVIVIVIDIHRTETSTRRNYPGNTITAQVVTNIYFVICLCMFRGDYRCLLIVVRGSRLALMQCSVC